MCERCSKLRTERKEAILEFLNTESSYGEDLRIIKEEFYCPMQSAGLLTAEQLTVVFSNVQELIDVNDRFTEHLQDSIDQAFDQVTSHTHSHRGSEAWSHLSATAKTFIIAKHLRLFLTPRSEIVLKLLREKIISTPSVYLLCNTTQEFTHKYAEQSQPVRVRQRGLRPTLPPLVVF